TLGERLPAMEALPGRGNPMKRLISLLFHDVYVREPCESGFDGAAAERYKIPVRDLDAYLAVLDSALESRPILAPDDLENAPVAGLPVAITVDDGGVSYHGIVAERLEERGWRGHCFVTTSCIGRRGFLDKAQLRDLHERGHILGSHSVSHRSHLAQCAPELIHREWADSRKCLEDLLGAAVTCASVPGGYYGPRVAREAARAGLEVLFTSEPNTAKRTVAGCMVMGRFTVRRGFAPQYVRRLATGDSGARARERVVWQGKKSLKGVMGGLYPLLSERVQRRRTAVRSPQGSEFGRSWPRTRDDLEGEE
ncbi:MAG: polysaccharide deacetylase family protein, partial [Gammaproteobacteria bacterium]|nr:polysaccharide deacetylase family protein [Gammaproteobacteria bacterium]